MVFRWIQKTLLAVPVDRVVFVVIPEESALQCLINRCKWVLETRLYSVTFISDVNYSQFELLHAISFNMSSVFLLYIISFKPKFLHGRFCVEIDVLYHLGVMQILLIE